MESLETAHGGEHTEPAHTEHPPAIEDAHHAPPEAEHTPAHAEATHSEPHGERAIHHAEHALRHEVTHAHEPDPQAALAAFKRPSSAPMDIALGGAAMTGYVIAKLGKPFVNGYFWVLDKVTTPVAERIVALAKKIISIPPLSWIYNLGKGKGGHGHGGSHDAHAGGAHH